MGRPNKFETMAQILRAEGYVVLFPSEAEELRSQVVTCALDLADADNSTVTARGLLRFFRQLYLALGGKR